MTHITSCRNVISIEHTTRAVSVAFWKVLPFRKRKIIFLGFVLYICNFNELSSM